MIADGSTLENVLDHLCRSIDEQIAPFITTILLMDPDGEKLWPAAGPRVPAEWIRAITPLPVSADIGLCGTAAYRKSLVVVPDVAAEPVWQEQYRTIALRSGIRAAWSRPVLARDNEVLGTFAIYAHEPRVPTESDLALIESAEHIALIAIERQRAHAALAQAHEELASERDRLRLLVDVQRSLVPNLDLRTLFTGLAASLQRVTDCDFIGLSLPALPASLCGSTSSITAATRAICAKACWFHCTARRRGRPSARVGWCASTLSARTSLTRRSMGRRRVGSSTNCCSARACPPAISCR